jgi:hypothetical protein
MTFGLAAGGRRFAVVTTCNAAGYEAYGRSMVESFDRHWPVEVPLLLYCEGFAPKPPGGRIVVRDLIDSSPELAAFKHRHADNPLAHGLTRRPRFRLSYDLAKLRFKLGEKRWGEGYRWNAVRFAHKSFAIFHAAAASDIDVLIWVDADTRFFADVRWDEIEGFIPADCFVGYLRRRIHSECGFVAYNLRHPATREMLAEFERLYTRDEMFREYEFHDSYLFDLVRKEAERRGHRSYDIAGGLGLKVPHVLINSRLGRFMDHLKGGRKADGRSRVADLVLERPEAYWRESG